jgi:hypothetical protein
MANVRYWSRTEVIDDIFFKSGRHLDKKHISVSALSSNIGNVLQTFHCPL